jgi:CHAT domain-containing protein
MKEAIYQKAQCAYENRNYDEAITHYRSSIKAALKELPVDCIFVFEKATELAHICCENDDYECTFHFAKLAYNNFIEVKSDILSQKGAEEYLETLGNSFMNLKRYNEASICFESAELVCSDLNDRVIVATKKFLAISQTGSILDSIRELKNLYATEGLSAGIKRKILNNLAALLYSFGQNKESLTYYQIVFKDAAIDEKNDFWLMESFYNMAIINYDLGDYLTALSQFKKLFSVIRKSEIKGIKYLQPLCLIKIVSIYLLFRNNNELQRFLDIIDKDIIYESDRINYCLLRAEIELNNLLTEKGTERKYLDIIQHHEVLAITSAMDINILSLQSNISYYEGNIDLAIQQITRIIQYFTDKNDDNLFFQNRLRLLNLQIELNLIDGTINLTDLLLDAGKLLQKYGGNVSQVKRLLFMAAQFYKYGEYSNAYAILVFLFENDHDILKIFALSGNEQENIFYQDIIDKVLNLGIALLDRLESGKVDLEHHLGNFHLRSKSFFLLKTDTFRNVLSDYGDKEADIILEYRKKWKELNSQISGENPGYEDLKTEVSYLENRVKHETSYFNAISESLNISWSDISRELKPNEAAMSFVRYQRPEDVSEDAAGYCVFLIYSELKRPALIKLDVNDGFLKSLLPFFLLRDFKWDGTLYEKVEKPMIIQLQILFTQLIKPVEKYLHGIKKIFYTVDGLLNYIPFGALLDENNSFFLDKFVLVQLQNLKNINNPASIRIDRIDQFGGIDFGKATDKQLNSEESSDPSLSSVNEIPFSLRETNHLIELSKKRNRSIYPHDHLDLLTLQNICNEEKPSCIHILTHGFFFNDENKMYNFDEPTAFSANDIKTHSNPLLRSGIIASNYNALSLKQNVKPGDTGVITSYDISRLDFWGVSLVSLHACNTAIGAVRNGETYGLPRAFKIAGVKYVILTLWKIQFTEFFIHFYKYLLEMDTANVREAFDQAVSEIRRVKPNPYWWSGFVLIE